MKYIGLLGGSFNPVHVGHIRLAIEVLEYKGLPFPMERVDLIPCAHPPHKEASGLLPFSLRYAMLKACCASIEGMEVNGIESLRQGLSYTWHTLENYAQSHEQHRLLFMAGMENLHDLSNWYRGLELPLWADLGIVPRAGGEKELFIQQVLRHWPHATIHQSEQLYASVCIEEQERYIFYMPLPRMDISASYIRERWHAGGQLNALIPDAALKILLKSQQQARLFWK